MAIFHVYVQCDSRNYAIAFANDEVADEWWRAISTHPTISKWIKRVSPQLYAWTGATKNGGLDYGSHEDVISQCVAKMVSLWQYDSGFYGALGIIPVQDTTNQASGHSFFIRSKVEPYEYWYCPPTAGSITEDTHIYTSREERTRFCVRIADEKMQPGTIMIGTDKIIISPAFAPTLRVSAENGVARLGPTAASSESEQPKLKLSDVRTGFTSGARRRVMDEENDLVIVARELVEALDGNGEGWELV
ncbi:hypothetical protein FIBSPDRAFT_1052148 [Athelia psychrophila]|uniref:Uncharacterized protein n=1 Tax=Athelia psychrophila TaxID=1759441 RepID=A0A165XTT3_9AGAM|nr:hypothetical protein FIBSPDRAFT_1052148 [Fibularhizoctonia sp. CBS 109695]